MLQLKRTLEAATTPDEAHGRAPCGKRLGLVFRIALEVGKAVRNPERLPQLEHLQAYGEGRLAKAPRRSAADAAEAAERSILRPAVAKCASKLRGFRNAGRAAGKTPAELGETNGLKAETLALLRGEKQESGYAPAQAPEQPTKDSLAGLTPEQRALLFLD
eukprot:s1261_g3.t1